MSKNSSFSRALLKFPNQLAQPTEYSSLVFLVKLNGTHNSEDEPPDLPFFTREDEKVLYGRGIADSAKNLT